MLNLVDKMLKYNAHHYNDYLNLKISTGLWFCLLYGARHLVFFSLLIVNPDYVFSVDWLNAQSHWLFIIADLPASLVLLATGHRLPEAKPFMRWIWNHGKHMLVSSYVLGICVFLYLNLEIIQQQDTNSIILSTSVLIADILIIATIIKSELMQDIFSEFPSAPVRM